MLQRFLATYRERRRLRLALRVTLAAARVRAARGAAYLDGADDGWHTRLNTATLELADGASCVLGQLHGGFRHGLLRARVLDLSSAPLASLSPVDLGFQARRDLGEEIEALDYAYLNRAWREELGRRGASRPTPGAARPAAAAFA
ncbi:MAG: hypothetical protein ABJF88_14535 [Rhodothermales bacterium]